MAPKDRKSVATDSDPKDIVTDDAQNAVDKSLEWLSRVGSVKRSTIHLGLTFLILGGLLLVPWDIEYKEARWIGWGGIILFVVVASGAYSKLHKLSSLLPTQVQSMSSGTYSLFQAMRRIGIAFLGLAFFALWSCIYMVIWSYNSAPCSPDPVKSCSGAFYGADSHIQLGKWFYYSINQAFANPPSDFWAASSLAQTAATLQLLLGVALITFFASALFGIKKSQQQETEPEEEFSEFNRRPTDRRRPPLR